MPSKEIKFVANLDDSQINQSISNIMKKMKEMNSASAAFQKINQASVAGGMPPISPLVQQGLEQAQNRRLAAERANFADQKKLLEEIAQKNSSLTKIIDAQTAAIERRNKAGRDTTLLEAKRTGNMANLSSGYEAFDKQARMTGARAGGLPGGNGPSSMGMIDQIAKGIGSPMTLVAGLLGSAAIVAAVAKVVSIGFSAYQSHTAAPMVAAAAQGSAVNTVYGREVNAIYSGRNQLEASYSAEKMQSMDIAKGQRAGHEIGNIFSYNGLLSMLGDKNAQRAQSSLLNQQLANDRETTLNGLIDQDPFRKAATEKFQGNARNNLQFQRQFGLQYGTFHDRGGFSESVINKGFDDVLGMDMSRQIMGAGGSTGSSGKDSAITGLQAQRNFNLTNAGSILGKLSSTTSNPNESKEALVRILAEGTRLGFDGSHYVEESRKFTDIVAGIIEKSGSTNAEDVARNAKSFSEFVTDPTTTRGINSAKSAYDTYQEQTAATNGRQAYVKMAAFMNDPLLSKMDYISRSNFLGAKEGELTVDNAAVKKLALETGASPEEILQHRKNIDQQAAPGGLPGFKENLAKFQALDLKSKTQTLSEEDKKTMDILHQSNISSYNYVTGGKLSDQAAISAVYPLEHPGQVVTKNDTASKSLFQSVKDKLESIKGTGKAEDVTETNNAIAAKEMLNAFRENKDTILQTTAAIKEYNAALHEQINLSKQGKGDLNGALISRQGGFTKQIQHTQDFLDSLKPINQEQGSGSKH